MNCLMKAVYKDLFGCKKIYLSCNGCFGYDDYLNFSYCASLTRLPNWLRVGGWLDLCNCKSLTQLPDGLIVGGYI